MNIVLVEFLDEANELIKEFERDSIDMEKTVIIGFNPQVRTFLKDRGIHSKATLDYFDNESHAKAIEKSEELIRILEDNINITDEIGIKEAYINSFILYVRVIISYYLNMIELLEKISQKHKISELITFHCRSLPFNSPDLQENERYLSILAERFTEIHNVKLRKIKIQTSAKTFIKNIGWFEKLLFFPIAWNYILVMRLYRNSKSILIADFSYNMDFLVEDIKKNIPEVSWILFRTRRKGVFTELAASFVWLMLSFIKRPIKMSQHKTPLHYSVPFYFFKSYFYSKKICLDKEINIDKAEHSIKETFSRFNNVFYYKGVYFGDLLLDKIKVGILPFIRELEKDTSILYYLVKKINPDFIISPVARDIYFSLGEVAKILNIPSLLISHASHIKPKNRLEEIEHDHLGRGLINTEYSFVAVQSPHARDYARHFNIKSKVIHTGPLLWGRVNTTRREIYEKLIGPYQDKRILLHAGTPKVRANIRFHIYETLDEYVEGIKDIIESIETIDNILLVIQFRPWSGLSLKDLKASLPNSDKVKFSTNIPFRDVISIADALISFSSTTIEEALYNKIPVLLYGGGGRYIHLPAFVVNDISSMRRSACYHVPKKELLGDTIDWVLNEHIKVKLNEEDLKGHIFNAKELESLGNFISKQIYNSR